MSRLDAIALVRARVNDVPPTLSNLAVSASNEGSVGNARAALTGTIASAGPDDTFQMKVNWGDQGLLVNEFPSFGTLGPTGHIDFTLFHSYADNLANGGTYPINVQLRDNHMLSPDATPIMGTAYATVYNVAPSALTVSLGPATFTLGTPTVLTGNFVDPGVMDTHVVNIDWGDGHTDAVNLAANVLAFTSPAHTYTDSGIYQISTTVTDKDGAVSNTATATATVNPVPGVVQNLQVSNSLAWDDPYGVNSPNTQSADLTATLLNFSPTRPITVTVNWGDGGWGNDNTGIETFTLPAGVNTIDRMHDYATVYGYHQNVTDWPVTVSATQAIVASMTNTATGTTTAHVDFATPTIDASVSGVGVDYHPANSGNPEYWIVTAGVRLTAPSSQELFRVQFNLGGDQDDSDTWPTGSYVLDSVTVYSDPSSMHITATVTVERGGGAGIHDWIAGASQPFNLS